MGVCLSCLRGDSIDEEYNERTSLLHNNQYSDENNQEDIMKQQQRQAELNGIVNDLSDNLIDVSTFLSNSTGLSDSSSNRKQKILEEVKQLDEEIKEHSTIKVQGPLYLDFN